MKLGRLLLVIVIASLLSGCAFVERWVYRPDINQGNYITQQETARLQIGQTKEQVQYIMGSPMLKSVFGDDIWYYVFREQPHHGYMSQQTYTIVFTNGKVSDIQTMMMGSAPEKLDQ